MLGSSFEVEKVSPRVWVMASGIPASHRIFDGRRQRTTTVTAFKFCPYRQVRYANSKEAIFSASTVFPNGCGIPAESCLPEFELVRVSHKRFYKISMVVRLSLFLSWVHAYLMMDGG